jgi:hypothetical protein
MDTAGCVTFLEDALGRENGAIRSYLFLSMGVILSGLAIIGLALWFSPPEQKTLITLGGTFFSCLASFPIKEVLGRKGRISVLKFLLQEFKALLLSGASLDTADANLRDTFWKTINEYLRT